MRFAAFVAWVLLSSVALHGRAAAQTAEWSPPKLGTIFHVTGIPRVQHFEVVRIDKGHFETVTDRGMSTACRWPAIFAFGVPMGNEEKVKDKLWPLAVGKTVEYDSYGWENKLTVTKVETLQAAFGPVETFVIENRREGYGPTGTGFTGILTFWYAPRYGLVVKFNFRQIQGGANRVPSWEVTSVRESPGGSSQPGAGRPTVWRTCPFNFDF